MWFSDSWTLSTEGGRRRRRDGRREAGRDGDREREGREEDNDP